MKLKFYVLVLFLLEIQLFAQSESDLTLKNQLAASQYFLKDSQQALENSRQQAATIKQIAQNYKQIKENNIKSDINLALTQGQTLFCEWRNEKIDNGFCSVENIPATKEMLRFMRTLLFVLRSVDCQDQHIQSSIHQIYGQPNLQNLEQALQTSRKNLKANSWLVWYSCSKKTLEYKQVKAQEQKRIYDALQQCLFPELQSVERVIPLDAESLELKATPVQASAPVAIFVQAARSRI